VAKFFLYTALFAFVAQPASTKKGIEKSKYFIVKKVRGAKDNPQA
jgi:hypothetical protein